MASVSVDIVWACVLLGGSMLLLYLASEGKL